MRNPKPGTHSPFLRFHYHLACYIQKLERWFETHELVRRTGTGGRPPTLDLTPEQRLQRRKTLAKIAALSNYYLPKLNYNAPDITQLSNLDLRRFRNFYLRRSEYLAELKVLGGIPSKYLGVENPSLQSLLPTDEDLEEVEGMDTSSITQEEEDAIETSV